LKFLPLTTLSYLKLLLLELKKSINGNYFPDWMGALETKGNIGVNPILD
jgi:hypothetical protein